ncbi:6-phosphofructo-2-kinase/fructose-2,6-bisphosphatase 1-like [Galendromus occidentalis]|uniref:6-phosphofructo-2-kinase/fructose-2, 6-bisphosphatase 1-like n=1 Tax=Galendromus occidentalis TaxID=34638 RepID=A0AAJ6QPN5_9ACAR|nr:6-phosphofructo-2-kinase/fructose-2,6-bisphosphatase 1-like [Galendromus occidentalis]
MIVEHFITPPQCGILAVEQFLRLLLGFRCPAPVLYTVSEPVSILESSRAADQNRLDTHRLLLIFTLREAQSSIEGIQKVIQSALYAGITIVCSQSYIHTMSKPIFLTRHGESELNLRGRIGGDADLSARGWEYSRALAGFMKDQNIPKLRVWTSELKRTIQTAGGIDASQKRFKALNEIYAGICEEMTYEEIEEKFPVEFAARDQDKFHYRYPQGESYEDLVARLEPVVTELKRHGDVLVVAHQAVLRCVLGYFLQKNDAELPYLRVPLHAILKLTPLAGGCELQVFQLPIEAVGTHRG